jgi:predicted metal-dependent hydrolase
VRRLEGVDIVRSNRARRWHLEVPWGAPVRLTVPRWMSRAEIDAVLASSAVWIAAQRAQQVPRLGIDPASVDEHDARTATKEIAAAIAAEEAEALGVEYRQVRVGSQRTLWGSCSPHGTLSFNWRLALAPHEVLDYVVVHEVCHLRVADHSRRFWSLVESRRPCFREHRGWLREHGVELLAFAPHS